MGPWATNVTHLAVFGETAYLPPLLKSLDYVVFSDQKIVKPSNIWYAHGDIDRPHVHVFTPRVKHDRWLPQGITPARFVDIHAKEPQSLDAMTQLRELLARNFTVIIDAPDMPLDGALAWAVYKHVARKGHRALPSIETRMARTLAPQKVYGVPSTDVHYGPRH